MKITSICQPHFFPWIGYFNMINNSSDFIFLDNVQYNRRSWQNRVHIIDFNNSNKKWLSMPLKNSSRKFQINQVYLSKTSLKNFKNQLFENYKSSKYFEIYFNLFSEILENNLDKNLSDLNINIIKGLCKLLKINLSFKLSSSFKIKERKENLILSLLKENSSSAYLANDGSLNYANADFFKKKKIKMKPHNFIHPQYDQQQKNNQKFIKGLSIMDLLFNVGKDSIPIIKNYKMDFSG
jgi:hypothetical protein